MKRVIILRSFGSIHIIQQDGIYPCRDMQNSPPWFLDVSVSNPDRHFTTKTKEKIFFMLTSVCACHTNKQDNIAIRPLKTVAA